MTQMNFDLEDGLPPVSFVLKPSDVQRFVAFMNECNQAMTRVAELEAARIAYASEFEPDPEGEPDVGNIHANIRALKKQLAAPVASTPITIKELVKSVQAGEKWTVGEPEQLAAPADLVRRLLEDHQRVEPHHADQCELCREATAAIEGQSNSHQIAVKQPAPGERQPSMIASAVYTASGKVFIGSSEE